MGATAIFLLGGGIYNLVESPAVAYFVGERGRPIFYYPYRVNDRSKRTYKEQLTFYDASYITTAESMEATLVTEDD